MTQAPSPTYSFVIPVYNEEGNIELLIDRLEKVMTNISNDYEIIFVNDGSKDASLDVLEKLVEGKKTVKCINFSRNFGHQAALSAGLAHAKGQAIISMDCDLQDPPELIVQMVDKWKNGYDIVYARRTKRSDRFFKKYTAIVYYKILYRFSDVQIPRNVGDFRLVDSKVLDSLNNMPEKARYLRGMVAWVGFKHTFIDFVRPEREYGETNYTLKKMIRLSMDGLINFSFLPLKFGFVLGMLSITIGIIFLCVVIWKIAFENAFFRLHELLTVFLFIFMGFIFVLLWIIGEYIGRIYDESKGRPLYIIREKMNFGEDTDD